MTIDTTVESKPVPRVPVMCNIIMNTLCHLVICKVDACYRPKNISKELAIILVQNNIGDNAPINIMSHYPLPGLCREKVRQLTCFDTKTCPIHGEFDSLSYACAIIKSTDGQTPDLFIKSLVGKGWDLTNWHVQ